MVVASIDDKQRVDALRAIEEAYQQLGVEEDQGNCGIRRGGHFIPGGGRIARQLSGLARTG